MIDEALGELRTATGKTIEALRRELGRLRTGRAHAGMLDSIRIDYYGQSTPLAQMATIAIPEPRLITVKAWEKKQVQAIDKAIRESDLGFNPQVDGDLIRIPVPPLSEERRRDLVKIAKRTGEEAKVGIRKARHECIDLLNEIKKEGDASEDVVERAKKKAEDVVHEAVAEVDNVVAAKEKDILVV
ncbi:MAG: ribosome recycling factor [Polyangiaceae bacterium]|nr:ribosome recycling factor [Polyangiaceae bacterium]